MRSLSFRSETAVTNIYLGKTTKNLLTKLTRSTGILSKARYYLPYHTMLNLYHALFNSHLTYGSMIWGQVGSDLRNKLSTLQNKVMRIIHFKYKQFPCDSLYQEAKILKLVDQVKTSNCLLAYNQINNNLPTAFSNFLKSANTNHNYNTHFSRLNLNVEQTNTIIYRSYSIKTKCVTEWNSLHKELSINIETCSRNMLKKALRKYFINNYGV